MFKKIILLLLVAFPLTMMAQDPFGGGGSNDDPFGGGSDTSDPFGGSSSDDPFGQPTSQPQTTPQPTTEPAVTTQPTVTQPADTTDPFAAPSTNSADNDPFSSGAANTGGLGSTSTSSMGGGSNAFDNMVDTLSEPLVPEFPWKQQALKERPILNNYEIKESDVFWAKTIYREIDIREKMNHPFAYPRAPFMTILLDVLTKNPDVKVYKEDVFSGRDFSETSSWNEIKTGLGNEREETIFDIDEYGNEITSVQKIVDRFRSSKVKRFKVKEVWFFDKKQSRMKVRIMGIAPMMEVSASDFDADAVLASQLGLDSSNAQQTLFWVYYPDIQDELARYETFNPLNDALRMSWDQLFAARYFSSYITKVSNPLDRSIKDYTRNSLEALWESERAKEEIFNFEQDLWSY